MTVIDLIIQLQDLPPNMEVKIDKTRKGADIFTFSDIVSVEEVSTSVGEKLVLISPFHYEPEEN